MFCAKSDARSKGAPSLRTIGGFLTVREVAEQLSVSPATVYALVERGEIAHVRISNAIRISPAALAALSRASQTVPARLGGLDAQRVLLLDGCLLLRRLGSCSYPLWPKEIVVNIREALVADVSARFPSTRFSIIETPNWELQIVAPNPALGFVSVSEDGEEATVSVGELTHGHFNPYDASLSDQARARRVSDAVMAFLADLLDDRVVVWSSGRGRGGGWTTLDPGSTLALPNDVSAHLWSGPYRSAP